MIENLCILFFVLLAFVVGVFLHGAYCDAAHKKPMEALGIEKFQRCEIYTTNCHSNWYEIVYKSENKCK